MADNKNDNVNHPQHYIAANGLETIDVIEAWTEGLEGIEAVCTANVIKYISRWKKKNGVEDLEKARWYLNRLIEDVSKFDLDQREIEAYCKNDAKKLADGAYANGGSPLLNSHYLSLEDLFCSQHFDKTPKHISDMWNQFTNGECWLVFRDSEAWDYMVEQYEFCGRKLKSFPYTWHGDKNSLVLGARWSPFEIEYNDKFVYNEFMVTCRNGELWWEIPEYDWIRSNRARDGKPIYYVGIESFCELYPAVIMPLTAPVACNQHSNKMMHTIDACTDETTVKDFIHGKTVWVAANCTRGVDELVHYLGCSYIGRTYGPSGWSNRKPLCEWSPIQYNKGIKPGDDKYLTMGDTLCFWVEEEDPRVLHWGLPPEDYQKLGTIGGKPFIMLITSED